MVPRSWNVIVVELPDVSVVLNVGVVSVKRAVHLIPSVQVS
jgi:hypothetical protein